MSRSGSNNDPLRLPLGEFLELLRSEGFSIGVDTHLTVQKLLKAAGPDAPKQRLKTLLAPVFVLNAEEQSRFYRIFDHYLAGFAGLVDEEEEEERKKKFRREEEILKPKTRKKKDEKEPQKMQLKDFFALLGIFIFALLMIVGARYWQCTRVAQASEFPDSRITVKECMCKFDRLLPSDDDADGVFDSEDNCPGSESIFNTNPGQEDMDGDGIGDACDADRDGDEILDGQDNCPNTFNPEQEDQDNDGIGNECDPDADGDGLINLAFGGKDSCDLTVNFDTSGLVIYPCNNRDNDFYADALDPCPDIHSGRSDLDKDGIGDNCDPDLDGDGIPNEQDNCEFSPNPDQADTDRDGVGDACDNRENFLPEEIVKGNYLPKSQEELGDLLYQPGAAGWITLIVEGIFLLCFPVFIILEIIRFRKRKLYLNRMKTGNPPFTWSVDPEVSHLKVYHDRPFLAASRQLGERLVSGHSEVDVAATIQATIDSGGFPNFVMRQTSRPAEYLLLIDRQGPGDHQEALYSSLAKQLAEQDLYIETWYFQGDPRLVSRQPGGRPIPLSDLQNRYADYRLLIFSEGDSLIDPGTGKVAEWLRIFEPWTDKAVLSPRPPGQWRLQELEISRHFLLLPATLAGISAMTVHFEAGERPDLGLWVRQDTFPRIPRKGKITGKWLRDNLPEGLMDWIAACALYPELNWGLTLLIGDTLSTQKTLLTEENLLWLVRLPWFREGEFPHEMRVQLQSVLPADKARKVRATLMQLMESQPPREDSAAWNSWRLELARMRYENDPKSRKAEKELDDAMRSVNLNELDRMYNVMQFKDLEKDGKLNFKLPDSYKKLMGWEGMGSFFKGMMLRSLWLLIPFFLLVFYIALVIPSLYVKTFSYNGEQYLLSTARDTARMYNLLGLEGDYASALTFIEEPSSMDNITFSDPEDDPILYLEPFRLGIEADPSYASLYLNLFSTAIELYPGIGQMDSVPPPQEYILPRNGYNLRDSEIELYLYGKDSVPEGLLIRDTIGQAIRAELNLLAPEELRQIWWQTAMYYLEGGQYSAAIDFLKLMDGQEAEPDSLQVEAQYLLAAAYLQKGLSDTLSANMGFEFLFNSKADIIKGLDDLTEIFREGRHAQVSAAGPLSMWVRTVMVHMDRSPEMVEKAKTLLALINGEPLLEGYNLNTVHAGIWFPEVAGKQSERLKITTWIREAGFNDDVTEIGKKADWYEARPDRQKGYEVVYFARSTKTAADSLGQFLQAQWPDSSISIVQSQNEAPANADLMLVIPWTPPQTQTQQTNTDPPSDWVPAEIPSTLQGNWFSDKNFSKLSFSLRDKKLTLMVRITQGSNSTFIAQEYQIQSFETMEEVTGKKRYRAFLTDGKVFMVELSPTGTRATTSLLTIKEYQQVEEPQMQQQQQDQQSMQPPSAVAYAFGLFPANASAPAPRQGFLALLPLLIKREDGTYAYFGKEKALLAKADAPSTTQEYTYSYVRYLGDFDNKEIFDVTLFRSQGGLGMNSPVYLFKSGNSLYYSYSSAANKQVRYAAPFSRGTILNLKNPPNQDAIPASILQAIGLGQTISAEKKLTQEFQKLIDAGKKNEAQKNLVQLVKQYPGSEYLPEWNYMIALTYLDDKPGRALPFLEKAMAQTIDDPKLEIKVVEAMTRAFLLNKDCGSGDMLLEDLAGLTGNTYPYPPDIAELKMKLANCYYEAGTYDFAFDIAIDLAEMKGLDAEVQQEATRLLKVLAENPKYKSGN